MSKKLAEGIDGLVLDFLHLGIVDLVEIEITRPDGDSPHIVMQPGEEQDLRATPLADGGSVLGGALDFTWTSSDDSVLRPILASPTAVMTVRAVAEGEATLTVEAEEQSHELAITVQP